MRKVLSTELIRARIRDGYFASDDSWGLQGAYIIPGPCSADLRIICSDGTDDEARGWEHVSVSLKNRTPNWKEMCFVKDLFWGEEETVIQFHPPKSEYINNHENCLHLWKQVGIAVELPPSILTGVKSNSGDLAHGTYA